MKIKQVYDNVVQCLRDHNKENVSFEAKQIVHSVMDTKDVDLIRDTIEISPEQESEILKRCEKRCEGHPLQYVLGEWDFYGRTYKVGEGVLIPRQDTETLCEVLLEDYIHSDNMKIIDLCSGSGCIAITLEKQSNYKNTVFALEKSEAAIKYLKQNISLLDSEVFLLEDDVLCAITEEKDFDIIVSNPPYLSKSDMENLQEEVKYEPEMALFGEEDGLYFYEQITNLWKDRIKSGGILAYEIGINQENSVKEIMLKNGFYDIIFKKDLCGIIRVVIGTKQ